MSAHASAPNGEGTRPSRVLVAEDDAALRLIVVEALFREGCQVVDVADGTTLRIAALGPAGAGFDLIVSDIRLPGADGLSILAELRGAGCAVPAILMTAFGDAPTRRRAEALGALLLNKPFDIYVLTVAARRLLYASRSARGVV